MEKNRICVIGQFPPPIHGLSAALETLTHSKYMNDNYEIQQIDIKDNKGILRNLRKIKQGNADVYYFTIAQSTFGNLRDMGILWTLLKKKKKVVVHYHGGYYKELYRKMNFLQKKINKSLLSEIDVMIALSEGLKEIFSEVIDSNKIRVCENYIEDASLITDETFEEKIQAAKSKEKVDVLYLSNFIKSKGYLDLLEAARKFKDENVHFHFAGNFYKEEDKLEFMNLVEQEDLSKYVTYHGVVKGDAKKELLRVSDVFVLPTYYPNEGQPISIIEAMGNGLTIISTSHAGIPDIVKRDNGFLVESKSPPAIEQKLKFLMGNKDEIIKFGKNNRKITMEKFREIHYIYRLDAIFNEVLEK